MRDFTRFFLRNRALSWLLLGLVLAGGLFAYLNMGKLEDAPFTIKQALVTTSYPGASPMEVREQVTDILEEAIQSLGELYYLKSDNRAGLSKITVYVKKEIRTEDMQQLWDKLRRKVGDAQSKLPAGASPSVVNDDFGDVLGVFYSLSSPTHTYREMEDQAREDMPEGYNLDIIYDQGHESAVANEGFILNLILSVLTVVIVLLLFIGLKNGFLIGSGLVFSIFGTLIYMQATGIALQRMSLAAIIIAMGILVDNAIVVYDAALVNMQRGARKRTAILDAVTSTAMPLLGATLIAVLTFLPIYLSPHITGELLSSLFIVIAVSLLLSWVLAITQNVFFVQEFVCRPRPEELKGELFSGRAYDLFRRALAAAIHWRYVILSGMVVALLVAGWGFRFIPRQFMPLLNKQYFSIDMWLTEGTRFEECERQAAELTDLLREYEGVKKVSTFVGQTPPRYYLANAAYGPQPNYAQFLVETETPERSAELRTILYDQLPERFPNALVRVNSFEINSIPQALIEARFCGDDPRVLDSLTNEAIRIMRRNPKVLNARNEWGNQAMMIKIGYDPIKAGRLNIGREEMTRAVKSVNDGTTIGLYRDNDKKVPVLIRADEPGDWNMDRLADLPVWNGSQSSPLAQVAKEISLDWEYPLVRTYDRQL